MIIGLTLFSLGVFFTNLISALSDYNEKFKKDENTTTNRMILKLHRFFKKFETCKKQEMTTLKKIYLTMVMMVMMERI